METKEEENLGGVDGLVTKVIFEQRHEAEGRSFTLKYYFVKQ